MKDRGKAKAAKVSGAFRLLGKYQPMYYVYMVPLILVSSMIPLTGVWLPKVIIELLTEGQEYSLVLRMIGLYIAVLVLANFAKNALSHGADMSVARLKSCLQMEIGKAAMGAKIKDIENARYREEILLAGSVAELSDIMSILQGVLSSAVTVLGLASIIVRVDKLFFLLVGLTLGLKVGLSLLGFRYDENLRKEEADNNKVGGYLDYLQYYNEGAAKEVRVGNAQEWMFGKISAFRDRMVNIQLRSFRRYNIFEMLQMLAVAVQNILILLALSGRYMEGRLSIADFTLYFSSVTLLSSTLSGVADQMFGFGRKLVYCSDFHKIVDGGRAEVGTAAACPERAEKEDAVKADSIVSVESISFEDVCFSYPESGEPVLRGVSFQLHRGDRAMLVGANGSGKTTIIKLLCRFYEADSGRIFINGRDIRTIPEKQCHALIATVFQDFALFSIPISENVSLKEGGEEDSGRLWDCLRDTGLHTLVTGLKEKERTYISRLFSEDGVDLSGGERQRLGITRAIYKDAQILVLDEPAASLDVKMEDELYRNFYDMTMGKISLTVSHRLSQASVCNRIFVLDQGIICEEGSHQELMEKDGVYAAMFRKQSEAYIL